MSDEDLKRSLCDMGMDDLMIIDGYPEACLGYVDNAGTSALVYSRSSIRKYLMERDGMSEGEADEFIDFNISGAYVGKHTPLILEDLP